MGMTRMREGRNRGEVKADRHVALTGNPNVGKSTVFNALTGMRRHTGNWTGKTVDCAAGIMKRDGKNYALYDLPGSYSLEAASPEEEIARDFILSGRADCIVAVLDASCLERSLNLLLQTLELTDGVVVCINLSDEAAKRGIRVDAARLSELLGAEVIETSASSGRGLDRLCEAIVRKSEEKRPAASVKKAVRPMWKRAEEIAREVVTRDTDARTAKQLRLDRFLTGRITGTLSMLLLLGVVFFITMVGANLPSAALARLFGFVLDGLKSLTASFGLHPFVSGVIVDGGLSTLFTVVSVMLPPMAIFFPLFTLLEDLGLLPRVAFNLDCRFRKCGGCGKLALTTCMGFGCNAAGVVGCRIIESPRERLIGILTNSLVPCNGRFPTLTALIAAFLVTGGGLKGGILGAAWLMGFILLALGAVFLVSKLLSVTLLKGKPSSFVLELPPFRKPRVGQILIRSLLDRTLFVLGRAAAAAFPAGMLIWILSNVGGETPPMTAIVGFLDPLGRLMGVDGTVLTAFVLGLPANELIMPLMLGVYGADGGLASLTEHGWTWFTALQVMLLMLFHSPCATTLLTVRRETRSFGWTLAAFLIPSAMGVLLLMITNLIMG